MSYVYVLNKEGKPLMPTERCGHVRILLKQKKARVVDRKPFTIKLLYDTPDVVQSLYLGIDPGRTEIGVCVIKEDGEPVFNAKVTTRNKEIPKLMLERKGYRLKHRGKGRRCVRQRRAKSNNTVLKTGSIERHLPQFDEGKTITCKYIRNKQAKFANRIRPDGWLTPTANQLLLTHVNIVKKIQKFLPISNVVLELNKFAAMRLEDSTVKGNAYQNGPLKGFDSVKQAVESMQNGRCLLCSKPIKECHYIKPKSRNGSNTIGNRCGLCAVHSKLLHTDESTRKEVEKKVAGLYKKYDSVGILNQIFPKLVKELERMYPKRVTYTNGAITNRDRQVLNIEKNSVNDAYCIALSVVDGSVDFFINNAAKLELCNYEIKQFRRHNRKACLAEMVDRKYTLNGEVVAVNRHKRFEQQADSLEEFAESHGEKVVSKLQVKKHLPKYMRMNRLLPGARMLVDGEVKVLQSSLLNQMGTGGYYKFTDGSKVSVKSVRLLTKNEGLMFV